MLSDKNEPQQGRSASRRDAPSARPEGEGTETELREARKNAEAIARENAERFQLALAAGRLGDWSWDAATDLISLGQEGCKVFGLPEGATLTRLQMRAMLHPSDRERSRLAWENALLHHTDYHAELRVQHQNTLVWIAVSARGIYSPSGAVLGMTGVVQDITERKETEKVRSRLAAVVESSDDAIISMDLDTRITTWNKGAERMFGYSAAEVIGQSVALLIPPESDDEEPEILRRLLAGERVDHYETIRRRKDGALLNVSLTVSPVHDASGRIVGVSKISRDITDRKRAEATLQEETRVMELLNKSGRAIASQLDIQAVVQTVTDSATELSGAQFGAFFYNVLDDQGASYRLYTLSGAPREAFEKFGQPRATPLFGPTFRGEAPVRCDDVTQDPRFGRMAPHFGMPAGHLPVKSYLALPVISRAGEVIGGLFFGHSQPGVFTERSERLVLGIVGQAAVAIDNARLYQEAQREISRRKKVEEALREAQLELQKHAEKLEEQVHERTARLRETIQELEAFSYSISHDMRSPLRAMQGYSDILLEDYKGQLDATAEDYLQRIRRSASRMDLLIQDVLAYSRVAKGEIRLEKIEVENIIRDVLLTYPAMQSGRASVSVSGPIPPVLGHEAYLTQIVSNLLGNAVKFVAPGVTPVIKIHAELEPEYVRLTFADNGVGIAPEHLEKIFHIFGRVYPEKQFEGTGIGLAIVKKAAERMGGTVTVDSQLGVGSRFIVRLKKA